MKRIAVIGGGVAGLYAAYQLGRTHQVTLFEKAPRIGGHAYTVPVGEQFLDIAFLVFNSHAYPRFIAWMKELGVEQDFSALAMSFGIETQGFAYSVNNGVSGLNLLRNGMKKEFRLLFKEIKRYRREIKAHVNLGEATIAEHFRKEGFSEFFITNFIYPLAISIWSLPGESIDRMLAQTFCQFMGHHRFLKENYGSQWLTFQNSSKVYKDKVLESNRFTLSVNAKIPQIRTYGSKVLINKQQFDGCIIATPADEAATLIGDLRRSELLSKFSYQDVKAHLHTDATLMPKSKSSWSAWNVIERGDQRFITYHLNRIRKIEGSVDYFLTLSESFPGKNVLHQTKFRHLILNAEALEAQARLHTLNQGTIAFAGSYFGKGFHEDAIASAARACAHLEEVFTQTDSVIGPPRAPSFLLGAEA